MLNILICLLISIISGYGLAVILVEKGKEWPIRPWRIRLQLVLRKIHWKLPQMLFCVTCTSFWTTFFMDLCLMTLCYFMTGGFYFLWPISGFVTSGFSWTIVEILNSLGKEQKINILLSGEENNEKL